MRSVECGVSDSPMTVGLGGGGAALVRSPQKCVRAGSQQLVPHPPDSDFLYSCLIQFTLSAMIKRSSAPIRNKSAFLCESHSVFTPHYSVQVPATLHHVINS